MKILLKQLLGFLCISAPFSIGAVSQVRIPFDHTFSDAGLIEQAFVVEEHRLYAVNLKYGFTSPSSRRSAWAFSGGTGTGAPFSVEVTVISLANPSAPPIMSRMVNSPKLTSWGERSLSAKLSEMHLTPGKYLLRVRLPAVNPPADVTLSAGVVIPYKGK